MRPSGLPSANGESPLYWHGARLTASLSKIAVTHQIRIDLGGQFIRLSPRRTVVAIPIGCDGHTYRSGGLRPAPNETDVVALICNRRDSLMNRILVALHIAAIFGSGFACCTAATITQSQGFAGIPTLSQIVEFDRFNPKYGQLLSADWQLVLDIEGGAHTVDNDGDTEKAVSVYLGARASISSRDVKLLDDSMAPILQGDRSVTTSTDSGTQLGDRQRRRHTV